MPTDGRVERFRSTCQPAAPRDTISSGARWGLVHSCLGLDGGQRAAQPARRFKRIKEIVGQAALGGGQVKPRDFGAGMGIKRRSIAVGQIGHAIPVILARGGCNRGGAGKAKFQKRVLFSLLFDEIGKLAIAHVQQLNGLLKLGGHHKRGAMRLGMAVEKLHDFVSVGTVMRGIVPTCKTII
jgi:hypothetical protein